MPVYGLPTALESSLNSLLQQRGPTSWRVSSHSEDITVVLRWTASKMWPAGASSTKEWSAASSKNWTVTPTPIYSSEKQIFDFNNVGYSNDDVFSGGSTGSISSNGKHRTEKTSKSLSKSHSTSSTSSSLSSSSQTHKISSSSKKRKRKSSSSSSSSSSGKQKKSGDRDRSCSRMSSSNYQTPTSSGMHCTINNNANNNDNHFPDGVSNGSKSSNGSAKSEQKGTKSIIIENTYNPINSSNNTGNAGSSSHLGTSGMAMGVSDPYPVYITSSESVIRNDLIMQDEIYIHDKNACYVNDTHHYKHNSNASIDNDCTVVDNSTYSPDSPDSKTDTKVGIIKISNIQNENEMYIESTNTSDSYNNQYQDRHNSSNQHRHHHQKQSKNSNSSKHSSNSIENSSNHHHKSAFKSHNKHNQTSSSAQRRDVVSPCNSNFYSVVAKALQKEPESPNNTGNGNNGSTKKGSQSLSRGGSSRIHRQASFDNSDTVLVERRPSSAMSDKDDELSAMCSVEILDHSD